MCGVEDQKATIQQLPHLDAGALPGTSSGSGWKLQPTAGQRDGVVPRHHSRIAAGQDGLEVAGGAPPSWGSITSGFCEAAVEVGDEVGQEGLGGLNGGDPAQPEFGHQAILEGLPQALDAALGLRTLSGNEADRQLAQHVAELGGMPRARELLFDRPVGIVADKDGETIAVEVARQAVCADQAQQQFGVAVQILMVTEVKGEDLAGGVIDRPQQGEHRLGLAQPAELTAIELDQSALARFA